MGKNDVLFAVYFWMCLVSDAPVVKQSYAQNLVGKIMKLFGFFLIPSFRTCSVVTSNDNTTKTTSKKLVFPTHMA